MGRQKSNKGKTDSPMSADTIPPKEVAQITLITPPVIDLATFPQKLEQLYDAVDIVCLRIALKTSDEKEMTKTIDALRSLSHARNIPVVINDDSEWVSRLGLDGVHLSDGARRVKYMRKELGVDAIVGVCCKVSRHEGISAAEYGADYISFSLPQEASCGGDTSQVFELFQWWSEMIEAPVVCENGLTRDLIAKFGPVTDHFAIGTEIWSDENPASALQQLLAPLYDGVKSRPLGAVL